jgi:transposase
MNILAMDLGKNNTVICNYDSEIGKHNFKKVKTGPQEIHDILVENAPDRVVFEIGALTGWVYDIVTALKIEVQVANTSHQAWRWKNTKKKNDRTDALKLAQLSAMNQLSLVHIPKPEIRQKRALIQYRQNLIKRRTQIKNNIRSILERQGCHKLLPSGKNGWSKNSVEMLNKMAVEFNLCDMDQLWKGELNLELRQLEAIEKCIDQTEQRLDKLAESDENIKVLQSIKGVGARLSEALAAFVDEPARFKTGKQVGSYIGLTPRQYQSGQMDHQGKISGAGNKVLRSLLVEVCWLGLRHNKWMNETYHRILRGSKSRKKIAITAVARKLLVRCWAMMRDKKNWCDVEVKKVA